MKNLSLMLMLFLFSMALEAQIPTNFSGKWEFDKAKSGPNTTFSNYGGTVVRQIVQNSSRFTYRDIYIQKGSSDWNTTDEVFNLDGKDQIKKNGSTTNRKSATWSQEKQVLTLTYAETYIENGVSKELLVAESYKLSDNGRTLIIETYSKNQGTGETKTTSVYRKK